MLVNCRIYFKVLYYSMWKQVVAYYNQTYYIDWQTIKTPGVQRLQACRERDAQFFISEMVRLDFIALIEIAAFNIGHSAHGVYLSTRWFHDFLAIYSCPFSSSGRRQWNPYIGFLHCNYCWHHQWSWQPCLTVRRHGKRQCCCWRGKLLSRTVSDVRYA